MKLIKLLFVSILFNNSGKFNVVLTSSQETANNLSINALF